MLPRDDGSVPEALLPSWPPLGTRGSGPLLAALRNQHSNCGSEGTEWKMVSATIPPSRFWKAGSLHFVENKELEFWGCEELLKLLQQANKTTLLFQGSESWTEKPAAQCHSVTHRAFTWPYPKESVYLICMQSQGMFSEPKDTPQAHCTLLNLSVRPAFHVLFIS